MPTAIAWIVVATLDVRGRGDDWRIFWEAGHHVGSPALLTSSHFIYVPGSAWALAPFAHLPSTAGFFCYAALMLAASALAAVAAAKIYRLDFPLALTMALAWFPLTLAICLGQNSPIALLLTVLAILAVTTRNQLGAGAAIALLLYKPSDAFALLALILIRKQWRALAIVAASLPVWYVLSAAATHDWAWPAAYAQTLATLYRSDAILNGDFAIGIPGLLMHAGLASGVAIAIGIALFLATLPVLRKAPILEAASMAPLIGVATGPHAYGYEAILALPALWLAVAQARAPQSGRAQSLAAAAAYCIAPFYIFSRALHFDALAIPVIGAAALWTLRSRRASGARS